MLRLFAFLLLLLAAPVALYADDEKPDDSISVNFTTEGWVSTKKAHVTVMVNAAVAADQSGEMRDTMMKTVQSLSAAADWKLTSFNRSQDETGLERWYANYEARLEEKELGGLAAKAKASGKAGMQLQVTNIQFTPTLSETETVRAELRKKLLAEANKELEAINAALPGRNFRLSHISFEGAHPAMQMHMRPMQQKMGGAMMAEQADMAMASPVETAQRMQITAQVTFAALPALAPKAP